MTRRLLPRDEWSRLADTPELGPVWQLLPPSTDVIVVEDGGRIVATWALLTVKHCEGAWVDPAHPFAGVLLMRGLREAAKGADAQRVWTGAATPEVRGILERMGAERVGFDSFIVPLTRTHKGES